MEVKQIPFKDYLLDAEGEEIVWVEGKALLFRPATEDDIERVGKGYFSLDRENTVKWANKLKF